jgi:crotonobetainyl-CoA:carnitine CoA-transferase CaiB-like acyl-CoA transferase
MSEVIPTVRVLHPDHPDGILMNEADLTDEHVLVDPKAEKARRKSLKETLAAEIAAEDAAEKEAAARAAHVASTLASLSEAIDQGAKA